MNAKSGYSKLLDVKFLGKRVDLESIRVTGNNMFRSSGTSKYKVY